MKESNRDSDEDLIRIDLQNREFFLIIIVCFVTAVSMLPLLIGQRSYAWHSLRHTQRVEKERTVGGAVLSLFWLQKHYTDMDGNGQEGQKKTCRKKQHVKIDKERYAPKTIRCMGAVGKNYNSTWDNKEKSTEKIDGAIATIMGLDRAIRCGNSNSASVYDERGILYI